jgi:hypothetical protein
MAILGGGVGGFSAAMPSVILAVTPAGETSSAMSVNQVVRSVGFAIGSAVCGFHPGGADGHGTAVPRGCRLRGRGLGGGGDHGADGGRGLGLRGAGGAGSPGPRAGTAGLTRSVRGARQVRASDW